MSQELLIFLLPLWVFMGMVVIALVLLFGQYMGWWE